MNKLQKQRYTTWCKYHITGCSAIHRIKRNAVFIHTNASLKHELMKAEVCYNLRKQNKEFITEAVDNKTKLRHDVVCLDDGVIYEIETDSKRAARFKSMENVVVIMV